ncbi:uncharacterized protein ATNIH1004_005332 [Aspergillus tanneri]|uniref:WSC domain-containing protein n=1 Tax=Aspergillus tanneri TaxID=1220188 RepID=A0A5M9MW19_9EURO|nr:uncharacterized protein ATNIH1004_005332 [Aspergillus tanneri]KAA8646657.1 hypothetical protein ATNIH1004_005332 [Aspergillus tanneri]
MTVENCEAGCLSAGYPLAGVEYSGQCFCDTALQNGGGPASDGNAHCTMTCNGNPQETCGGPDRLNIYRYTVTLSTAASVTTIPVTTLPASTTTSVPVVTALPTGWTYAGCYEDNLNGRVMMNMQPENKAMTVESCVATCTRLNYTVAGMEYASQCFCDQYVRNGASLRPSSECNMACAGNMREMCGGPDRLSVYYQGNFTVLPVPTPQTTDLPGSWQYVGCLPDNVDNARTFPYQIVYKHNNSATTCLSRCAAFGFGAAGMEFGEECYCGDASNANGLQLLPESECTMPCPGNLRAICGAGARITYYRWTGTPLQQWSHPVGSAAGRYEFLIGGVVVPLMTTLNINGKVTFLEKFGTGAPNTTGAYEFDPAFDRNFSLAWRPMHVKSDIFCSAGLVLPDKVGRQLTIGGWSGVSTYGIRLYWPDGSAGQPSRLDWEENAQELTLQNGRWYPTGMIMTNGSVLVVGGENGSNGPPVPTLEILPRAGPVLYMDWLNRTDPNNLYPFMTPLPGGGIFVAYYNEARILNENTFTTIKTLPNIPGAVNNDAGGRTYPLEGTMVLLPQSAPYVDPLTVLICGGSTPLVVTRSITVSQCNRKPPIPTLKRVLTCMTALPDGTYLILNGAHKGVAGFGLAKDPNVNAVLYDPSKPVNQRMSVMANTTIARMYHSEAILLPDGRVLVSGSDPQDADYPEEYRVEVFLPPYFLSGMPRPSFTITERDWVYGQNYQITIASGNVSRISLLGMVSSTHGNSFGQRTIFPAYSCIGSTCTITAPPDAHTSPLGGFSCL